jgi:Tfp pilus assembly PilM family ATPase
MNACQLRGLNVPPGTDEERRMMVADELADEWAERGPMEFDFWELEGVKAEKSTDTFNVNVLATSRPWVWQLARDCRQAGLDCWAIDGTPLAIARAVGLVDGASGGRRVLAMDWGYSNTTLCVVGDDRPLYVRRIHDCAFGRVLESIMQSLGVTLDEAQHLADIQGLVAPDSSRHAPCAVAEAERMQIMSLTSSALDDPQTQAAITAAAEETITVLVAEITRTLHYMETQRRHMHPTAIWLFGGGASLRNVAAYLAPLVPLPVHSWQMPAASEPIACASGGRSALFGGAVALSALAWGAA